MSGQLIFRTDAALLNEILKDNVEGIPDDVDVVTCNSCDEALLITIESKEIQSYKSGRIIDANSENGERLKDYKGDPLPRKWKVEGM